MAYKIMKIYGRTEALNKHFPEPVTEQILLEPGGYDMTYGEQTESPRTFLICTTCAATVLLDYIGYHANWHEGIIRGEIK